MKKLNAKQLKSIVESVLKEMPGGGGPLSYLESGHDAIGDAVEALCQAVEDQFMKIADGDPSINHDGNVKGFDDWRSQVSKATTEIWQRVEEVIEDVDRKLTDGEYWTGG